MWYRLTQTTENINTEGESVIIPLTEVAYDPKARDGRWCMLPYPNHPKGCPNHGQKSHCPPFAPIAYDFFDFNIGDVGTNKFISFIYEPTVKGNYTIDITLTLEGRVLLQNSAELTAFGELTAEFQESDLEIKTSDKSFKVS